MEWSASLLKRLQVSHDVSFTANIKTEVKHLHSKEPDGVTGSFEARRPEEVRMFEFYQGPRRQNISLQGRIYGSNISLCFMNILLVIRRGRYMIPHINFCSATVIAHQGPC